MRPQLIVQAKEEVKKLIEKAQSNDLEAQPGRTIMESFENQVHAGGSPGGRNMPILATMNFSACILPCLSFSTESPALSSCHLLGCRSTRC